MKRSAFASVPPRRASYDDGTTDLGPTSIQVQSEHEIGWLDGIETDATDRLVPLIVVLYLASTVPVGLFLYGIKNGVGIQIFKEGGFHHFMRCVNTSLR